MIVHQRPDEVGVGGGEGEGQKLGNPHIEDDGSARQP